MKNLNLEDIFIGSLLILPLCCLLVSTTVGVKHLVCSKQSKLFRLILSMFGNNEALLGNLHVRLDAHHEISQDLLN